MTWAGCSAGGAPPATACRGLGRRAPVGPATCAACRPPSCARDHTRLSSGSGEMSHWARGAACLRDAAQCAGRDASMAGRRSRMGAAKSPGAAATSARRSPTRTTPSRAQVGQARGRPVPASRTLRLWNRGSRMMASYGSSAGGTRRCGARLRYAVMHARTRGGMSVRPTSRVEKGRNRPSCQMCCVLSASAAGPAAASHVRSRYRW